MIEKLQSGLETGEKDDGGSAVEETDSGDENGLKVSNKEADGGLHASSLKRKTRG